VRCRDLGQYNRESSIGTTTLNATLVGGVVEDEVALRRTFFEAQLTGFFKVVYDSESLCFGGKF
jgi:hypothetical protein